MYLGARETCYACASQVWRTIGDVKEKKNPAAVALAKLRMTSMTAAERQECARQGGLVGGKARAATLTAGRRREIARAAAQARWGKAKKKGRAAKRVKS